MRLEKRRNKILELLYENKNVKTVELSELFNTTRQTIHSDIDSLAKEGKLTKVRGGAVLNKAAQEPNIDLRKVQFKKEKKAIGKVAASFIEEGDTLFLDVSTAITEMLPFLKSFKQLIIITTSIEVAYLLGNSENIEIIMVGGQIRHHDLACTGEPALSNIKDLYVDKAFFGVGGVKENIGFTEYHIDDSLIKKQVIQNASESFAVFDATKVGKIALHKFADLSEIDTMISYNINNKSFIDYLEKENLAYINAADY